MPEKYSKKPCDTCEYWFHLAGGRQGDGDFGCLQILDSGKSRKIENGQCQAWKERRKASRAKAFRIG